MTKTDRPDPAIAAAAEAVVRHGDPGGMARRLVTIRALTDVTRDGDVIVMDSQGRDVARIPSFNVESLSMTGSDD